MQKHLEIKKRPFWPVSVLLALGTHAVVFALLVDPIKSQIGIHGSGLAYAFWSSVAYFPASLIAWLSVYATSHASNAIDPGKAFIYTLLIAGGVWYALIGYCVGRWMDRRSDLGR